ncbi:Hypothetical protein Eab7_0356 [Exiguobacterium antarcticum B7]|nr:Hypothetical protein Eab7_0356 [Exiguobacterium antarcticum B7]
MIEQHLYTSQFNRERGVLLQDMLDRTNIEHPVELHRFCGVRMGEVAY